MIHTALFIVVVLNLILSIVNLIVTIDKKKKNKKAKIGESDLSNIAEEMTQELIQYCKEKYDIEAYSTTDGTDQISLACDKDDKVDFIIQLRFPMSPKGSPDYNSTLEYQKEEIDEWSKKNA